MANQGIYAEIGISAKEAEATLIRVQKLAEATEMSLNDLVKAGSQVGKNFDQGSRSVQNYGRKMTDGERALRGFYREQRLQDRTMRETIQTLTGLTFAFGYLSQGQEEAGSTTAKVTKSLMAAFAASQAAEFGFFALGQAGSRMGGTLGKVFSTLGRFAGPLSLVIGGVAGLAQWISVADEKMTQWTNTGIANMTKALIQAAGGKTNLLEKAIALFDVQGRETAAMQRGVAAQIGAPPVAATQATGSPFAPQTEAERQQQMLNYLNQQAQRSAPSITTRETAQQSVLQAVQKETEARQDIIDKIKDAIKEQEVMLSFEDKVNIILKEHGSEYTKIQIRMQEIGKALQFENQDQEKRRALIDEQLKLQAQVTEMNKSSLDLQTERTQRAQYLYETQQGTAEALVQELKAQRALTTDKAKQLQIDKAIWDIQEQRRKSAVQLLGMTQGFGLMGMNISREEMAFKEEQQRFEDANRQIRELGALERNTKGEVIKVTKQAQDALYANEQAHIRTNAEIQRQADEARTERFQDSLNVLATGMGNFFSKFDSDLGRGMQKLTQMLQIGLQIAKVLSAAAKPGGAGIGGLETVFSVLGLALGAFDKGGYTGSGGRLQPAGIVHRGEVVFEKPLVDRFGMEIMAMRAQMQRSYAVGGMVGAGMGGTGMGREVVITGRVDIDNGQLFLRKEMPGYQSFDKRKRI